MSSVYTHTNSDIYNSDMRYSRGTVGVWILAKSLSDVYEEVSPTMEYLLSIGDIGGYEKVYNHDIRPEE